MRRLARPGVAAAVGLGALAGAGWLGSRVEPSPFPPHPGSSPPPELVPLPAGLPPAVERYFRAVAGERVPLIRSAVLTGRARLRLSGLPFPARFRFVHEAGRGYRHYIECTWFGAPVMRVNEAFLDGHARLDLPFGTVAGEPKVDEAANLALWGEAIWFPSLLATDLRVRWEPIGETTARLVVPSTAADGSFTVEFDAGSGLLRSMEAPRYRSAADEARIPWRLEPLGWREFHGLRIPSPAAVTWLDQARPWAVFAVEDAAYNADVSEYLRAPGP